MKAARVSLGALVAAGLLAGCTTATPDPVLTHAPEPVAEIDLSGVCGMSAIVETTGEGYATRAEVIQSLIDWFSQALADLPDDAPMDDPPLEYDPVLLPIAVEGFTAALEALPAAEAADPDAEFLEVTGFHEGLPAASVSITGVERFRLDTYTYYWPKPDGGCEY